MVNGEKALLPNSLTNFAVNSDFETSVQLLDKDLKKTCLKPLDGFDTIIGQSPVSEAQLDLRRGKLLYKIIGSRNLFVKFKKRDKYPGKTKWDEKRFRDLSKDDEKGELFPAAMKVLTGYETQIKFEP